MKNCLNHDENVYCFHKNEVEYIYDKETNQCFVNNYYKVKKIIDHNR